jgi:excisionase family DNA binding protein
MHRRLQFGMRENPASDRRHGSRLTAGSPVNENLTMEQNLTRLESLPSHDHSPDGSDRYPHAVSPRTATGANKDGATGGFVTRPNTSVSTTPAFEPLIGSHEAARLLGNVHVKTLQRYARHGRVPGYQIGGHWYFRASDLDAWLRLRINSKSQSVR